MRSHWPQVFVFRSKVFLFEPTRRILRLIRSSSCMPFFFDAPLSLSYRRLTSYKRCSMTSGRFADVVPLYPNDLFLARDLPLIPGYPLVFFFFFLRSCPDKSEEHGLCEMKLACCRLVFPPPLPETISVSIKAPSGLRKPIMRGPYPSALALFF